LGATFTVFQQQEKRAGRQQGEQDNIRAMFEAQDEFHRVHH
jgi:hypothetical protein